MNATYQGLKCIIKFILESRKDKKSGKKVEEKVPILMSITFNGKRVFYNVGFRTDFSLWENGELYSYQKKNTFNKDGISAAIINSAFRNHAAAVDKIFSRFEDYPTVTSFREQLRFGAKPTD